MLENRNKWDLFKVRKIMATTGDKIKSVTKTGIHGFKDVIKLGGLAKLKYTPGQHFILDQEAIRIIKQKKIKTYILGRNLINLDNVIRNKKFTGTTIC